MPIVRVPCIWRAACLILPLLIAAVMLMSLPSPAFAQASSTVGGEAQLVIPDLSQATFWAAPTAERFSCGAWRCALSVCCLDS